MTKETESYFEVERVFVMCWPKKAFQTSVNDFADVFWGHSGASFAVTTEAALFFV